MMKQTSKGFTPKEITLLIVPVSLIVLGFIIPTDLITVRIFFVAIGGVLLLSYLVYKVWMFLTTENGVRFSFLFHEITYAVLGIPLIFIAIIYLPLFLIINLAKITVGAHFWEILLIFTGVFQVISLIITIAKFVRDEKFIAYKKQEKKIKPKRDFSFLDKEEVEAQIIYSEEHN